MKTTCKPFRHARLLSFLIFFSVSAINAANVFAGIKFSNLDLNKENKLLYIAEHNVAGNFSYKSVFLTKVENGITSQPTEILTCFPESMELLSGNTGNAGNSANAGSANNPILQIRNRYGTALYSFADAKLQYLNKTEEIPLFTAKPVPVSVSPNGKWLCFVRRNSSYTTGELVLQNVQTRQIFVINPEVPFSYSEVPVKWSPDSSTVLYEKNGNVCFSNPEALVKNVQIEEKFRVIGRGNINSFNFTRSQKLVYIDYDIVYALEVSELYTMALYSNYIGMGAAIARIPFAFDNKKDRFFLNDDASEMIVVQSNKQVSYYSIHQNDFANADLLYSQPVIIADANILGINVIWPEDKKESKKPLPVLQVELLGLSTGSKSLKIYRFDDIFKETLTVTEPSCLAVNPSATFAAYYYSGAVNVYDTQTWKRIASFPAETVATLLWNGNENLIVGGSEIVRSWNVTGGTFKTLFLASAKKVFWNEKENLIQAQTANSTFYYNAEKNTWLTDTAHAVPEKNSVQNGYYRVYIAESKNKKYENAIYVRTLTGKASTFPLFFEPVKTLSETKKVALVFDALDCADGIPQILDVIKSMRLNTTFFINGEFIRRYPAETIQIANAKQECASMFFTTADLTSSSFIINEDFIRRGLARNEDDFFACTGRELSLMWHAPYYKTSTLIKNSGLKAGYAYISVMGGNRDSIVLEENSASYKSALELIEGYMQEVKDGKNAVSIIPVSTGVSKGSRSDYLYEKLNLLVNLLLDSGCEIVPVSSLR
ncbi:MAG: polysaccharide deacetylase family protein [Treponema sp.]|nr:polysaccharide deacetylase family protein [Treponema sp.]